MKYRIIFTWFLFTSVIFGALKPEIGICWGSRTVTDEQIKEIYGHGSVFTPYLSVNLSWGFSAGLAYETGYNQNGKIGIYHESSSLTISGFEIFLGYQYPFSRLSPYIKAGYGSFSYKQEIENPTLPKINSRKQTVVLAGGLKYFLYKGFVLIGEIKMIPLKVKPLNKEVDLSGWRYSIGVGYVLVH